MKILQANKFFFPNGGSETVMFQEREFLLGLGNETVDFSMEDPRNLDSPYKASFVRTQDYRSRQGKLTKVMSAVQFIHSREAANKMASLVRKTRPDIVHCHNIYHQLTPSIIGAAKLFGIPVVLTLHDYKLVCPTYNRLRGGQPCSACLTGNFREALVHRCASGSFGKSALLYVEATVQRWMGNYEKVDAYIAPSRFMSEAIAHRVPKERIHLLYNGVGTDLVQGSGADDGYALYLGRLSSEKGVGSLLVAHESSGGAWPLVVAGTGPLEADLRSQYKKAKFIGHVTGDELRDVIDRAAVIVVPSEWYENCPMSVLEAMAYGKPVVGSRIGGIPELVADGETGLLFEPGNKDDLAAAMARLMGAPELRRQLGQAARKRVEEEFSLAKHNAGLMNVYKSVLGG
ncbi:glycosyltransferase family 1 protein [Parasulfuritortus cantonensis]|uniref:Glycosyltransferase family 1 protein n=1 Tax=Parasulfuritortus cantonensis TaxID=2528202 RepID=A0A4R1BKL9_9PROT|nr:glycosyltransferase family 4 protein [Parasulfuritortus cantonensis]TCJ17941.1 glycosyltransferase family 1 protein [Parasulfuritortus cantonensis]